MNKLNKKIKNVWIISSAFVGLIIGAILSTIIYSFTNSVIGSFVLAGLPVFLLSYYSYLRYKNWYFSIEEEYLEINHGVITKVSAVVPYVRVQHIDTNRGPIERILGLASLRVYTAGSTGADLKIPGLSREKAEVMQNDLRNKAVTSEHGFDGV